MRLSSGPAQGFVLFIHPRNNPTLAAMRWLFCVLTSGTQPGRAKPGSSCTLTYRVSCWSMQQCHVHYPVHRRQHFSADSITRVQGKNVYAVLSAHYSVQVRKAMGHVFLILSFCGSHFCVYYWDSSKENSGWCTVCECHLLLGCCSYPPSHLMVILPLFSSTWFYMLFSYAAI